MSAPERIRVAVADPACRIGDSALGLRNEAARTFRTARLGALRFRWVGDETFQAPTRRCAGPHRTRAAAADHRVHSPRRGNGRRSPAHFRARLLPRWRVAEGLGHRPTRQSLDRQVSKGNRRLTAWRAGRRLRCGSPARLASPHPTTRTDRGGRQGRRVRLAMFMSGTRH